MKRKLKITYGQLEATQERVSVFRNALENMDSAIEMFQNILSEQQSDAITALLEDGRDLRDEMELLHGNLQELENMLSGYIQDMTALVMPKSWDSMMLVDRNDIWVNMKQIKSNVSDTEQVIWGGALQHYKDVHTNIPKPHISSSMTEPEKRSAREEYDRKVRERAQREENYKKLKAFTETQAKQAKKELEECYKEIEDLYRNRIVVYENTDDEYKKTAMDLYQQCTDFGEKLSNFGVKSAKTVWDVRRGALAAVLDLVKTALAIQDLKNTLDTLPLAVVAEVMGIEVPGLSLEKVDDLKNMAYGAVAALQEPPRVLAAFGQKIGDTVEEEGIAYSISYVAADVAIQVLLSKGLGEVKNVSKADELADVARTVDTLDDTVKIADELTDAAKVVDQVGDIADAAMAVNAVNEANAAVKAVDEVNDVADAVKTVEKLDGVIESGTETIKFNEVKTFTAEETNQWFIDNVKPDYKPPYKPGTLVKEIELTENTTFVRVYDNMPDGSGMYGSWVMKADDIKGLTPLEIQNKFALPNTPKYVCDVELEDGTHIRVGEVNPLDGWGNGGGTQYDLIGQRIGDFKNERLLEGN